MQKLRLMANRHKRSSCSQATWTVSVLVLTLCLLVSQFLGFFHELYHPGFTLAPTQLGQQVSTSLSRPTFERTKQHDSESSIDLRHLLDSHFGYLGSEVCGSSNDSNAQCSNQEKQSCHLFDALMHGVCLGASIFILLLAKYSFALTQTSPIYWAQLLPKWIYQSRAPPIFN
jgi:hypothetical protein